MELNIVPDEDQEDVDITPMIDVVFLLVIFFMVTSTFIEEAKVYKIELPRATSPQTVSVDKTYTLSVTLEGIMYLKTGGPEVKLDDLEHAVTLLKEAPVQEDGNPFPVILRCDSRCEYSQYIQAKNALKLAGIQMIFEEVEVKR